MEMVYYHSSPIGTIEIHANENAVTVIQLTDKKASHDSALAFPLIQQVCRQLDEYFVGERKIFELPLAPKGTDFQQQVWKQLQQIPFGETISYAQLAKSIQNPKACRAVGSANGKNPIAIVIPCHRVIAANGSLGGYAYGLDVKKKLLDLEK